jgi:hypothetical protein
MSQVFKFGLIWVSLLTGVAFAVDLSVDMTTKILMPDGTPKKICLQNADDQKSCARTGDMTVGNIIEQLLTASIPNDPDAGKAGALAILVYGKDKVPISHEDQLLILRRADKSFDPMIIARLKEVLEPAAEPK